MFICTYNVLTYHDFHCFFSKGDNQGKKHLVKEVLFGILTDNLKPTISNIQKVAEGLKKLSREEVAQVEKDTDEVIKTSKCNLITNLISLEG